MGHIEENFHSVWRGKFGDRAVGHDHFWDRALSRRRFLGAAVVGGVALSVPGLGSGVAEAFTGPTLNPINGGTQLGPFFKHFYFPTLANPVNATHVVDNGTGDGATIRDFNGVIGVSEFPPTGVATDPFFGGKFWAADIRFMKGLFVGRDNHRHHATFAFVWLDVFVGAGGSQQVHDFNPGEENGLFWTVRVPTNGLHFDLDEGTASLVLSNFLIDDYGNVGNAISGGKEIGTALLSLDVSWDKPSNRFSFVNAGLPTPFRAKGFTTGATMSWSAVETIGPNTHTVSGAANSSDFGMVARERNGVFFPGEG